IEGGLVDVAAVSESELVRGGSTAADVFRDTLEQLRDPLLTTGPVSEDDLGRLAALFDGRDFVCMSPALVAAWGRRSSG
ncbi:MAG: hypothetical protein M3179_03650, partial [Actinomycetota bacterium]|nr:hypothetical protein [Actinomycetota bacterium]